MENFSILVQVTSMSNQNQNSHLSAGSSLRCPCLLLFILHTAVTTTLKKNKKHVTHLKLKTCQDFPLHSECNSISLVAWVALLDLLLIFWESHFVPLSHFSAPALLAACQLLNKPSSYFFVHVISFYRMACPLQI